MVPGSLSRGLRSQRGMWQMPFWPCRAVPVTLPERQRFGLFGRGFWLCISGAALPAGSRMQRQLPVLISGLSDPFAGGGSSLSVQPDVTENSPET